MLRQDINLLNGLTKPETDTELYTWKRFLLSNVIFTILMVILLLSSLFETHRLKQKMQTAQSTMALNQQQFDAMKSKLPQFLFGDNINDAVANMKKEMTTQKKIIAILASHAPFSEALTALSRTIIPDVWLTKIFIDKSGANIKLGGNSMGMNNLNDYIAHLNKDKLLEPYEVTIKSIDNTNVKDPKSQLSFELNLNKGANG